MEEGGGSSKRLMYTPHIKKVLKSYQASANKSLHGPNSVMGVWPGSESDDTPSASPPNPLTDSTTVDPPPRVSAAALPPQIDVQKSKPGPSQEGSAKDLHEFDAFIAPPPFPIQQPPIFTPADQTRCEKSETVLESETISCFNVGGEERLCLPQILNSVLRDFSLHDINCVCDNLHIYCSRCNQDQLDVLKATGILPYNAPSCGLITKTDAQRLCAALLDSDPLIVTKTSDMKPPFQVKIYHECFGECHGLYTPDLFQHPLSPCIECLECHALLNPQKFVCHVHQPTETRTCHWGFDVYKWRAYILLDVEHEEEAQFQQAVLEMKERFGSKYKRKQILEESCDSSPKRVRVESNLSYPFGMDPMLIYYYSQPHLWDNAFQTYPSVITKDGKALLIPPESFPHFIQKSFRNRLMLNPANVQKFMPMSVKEEPAEFALHPHKSETQSKRPHLKREQPEYDSTACFDSEDAYSDTSFSTLSAGTEDGLVSNFDDDDEHPQPSSESEFHEIKKVLVEVDASLRTKIMYEVESLIAKYRKCLSVATQGKKLYQMELEKVNYTQRAKLHKLREKNKHLEKEIQKLRRDAAAASTTETPADTKRTPSPRMPDCATTDVEIEIRPECVVASPDVTEGHDIRTIPVPSPTLPKQIPQQEDEPLGK